MILAYTLAVEDHLAWYDFYTTVLHPPSGYKAIPLLGTIFCRRERIKFREQMTAAWNHLALGPRSIELSAKGVREFNDAFEFYLCWEEQTVIVATTNHLFLAHETMNSRIIPFRTCQPPTEREAIISYVQQYSKAVPPIRNA
jgi:hypothetical protein